MSNDDNSSGSDSSNSEDDVQQKSSSTSAGIKRKGRSSDDDGDDGNDDNNTSNISNKYQKLDDNTKVVATHYNELKEKGLYERSKSRIFYMRNFNNWIKSMLINEYLEKIKSSQKLGSPLRVLDMCCGKGGDLLKWEKASITHLICTDIADVSIEQCEERYKALSKRKQFGAGGGGGGGSGNISKPTFSAEFIACDSTLVRLRERYKDPSIQLNLVSCQFAFHYCFESLKQAECMIRNAAECLMPGGYFIATIPDANEIMRRQREFGKKSFGNEVYNIEFVCDTYKPPLFGAKYKFHLEDVVDCPEFLVHFPTLIKLCRKYGLKIMEKHSFADYYERQLNNGKYLLDKMQALETYPPPKWSKLIANDEEYIHAKKYLEKYTGYDSKTVGTLSQSEWDATTLYLVCAFKKCKTSWDAEGKPVYEFDD